MPMLIDGDVTVSLVTTSCAHCAVVFAIPRTLYDKRQEDGGDFYCPNGHRLCYGRGETERLRRRLERAEGRERHLSDQLSAADRSNRALRGVITKQRKRAAAGVCPCCSHTFSELAEHMASEHPNYAEQSEEN